MEPISNADRLVLLLRQKLEERARISAGAKVGEGAKRAAPEPGGVRALASLRGADERNLRRAIIQNLLADQLKSLPVNDAQFQQLVGRVTEALEEDAKACGLLNEVVGQLYQP